MSIIKIPKNSDRIILCKSQGKNYPFKFNDSGLVDYKLKLVDSDGTEIHTFTKSGSTLVPVIVSEDDNGKPVYTASNDTDYFLVYLIKTYTANSAIGQVRAKHTPIYTNTNFTDDDTYDPDEIDYTNIYIISNI